MLYLRLAWRNIWRNRRRSFITMLSIVIAVLLASVMRSMQEGQYDVMVNSTVGTFTSYIQIHQQGYWDDQTLENSFEASDSLFEDAAKPSAVIETVPRLQSYALAAGKQQSRPAMIMGIDPDKEQSLSNPKERIESGSYFESADEQAVLVGTDMMERLSVQLGDSLVLIGQGFRGQSATGLYEIKGVVSFPNPEMNKNVVMMPLATTQNFLAAPNRLSALALILDDPNSVQQTVNRLNSNVDTTRYEIMSWQQMMPELQQAIQADRGGGVIIILILYIIVGFGILGTVLMMITERTYEFGVMLSIGTSRLAIFLMLALEILFIAFLGSLLGIALSIPVAWYFNVNPIEFSGGMVEVMESYGLEPYLPFSLDPELFYMQAIIIFIITIVFSIIPLIRASRLHPVKAMRS
ncbi:transporter [Aliifodinibius salipaludis]|uniref:Transporter n=1 Tax=Fodinibius salipaludis TaxID=2032627 RepID=A0A2A2G8N4_9BACT|nr:FtsX-like permease family protein [Aliifodinibius salipaludis]PAU93668.1 transporter [Aliifodinibius salipaludis]